MPLRGNYSCPSTCSTTNSSSNQAAGSAATKIGVAVVVLVFLQKGSEAPTLFVVPFQIKHKQCRVYSRTMALLCISSPPHPFCKHQEGQENDGHTGSWCLDKAVLPCDAWYQKNVRHRKPAHTSP